MKRIIIAASLLLTNAAQVAPVLNSTHAVVFDETSHRVLLEKNANEATPIASVTKVLIAMVALDTKPDVR